MIREIVTIDEEKCDGCGLCIPSCHEGALRLVDGKAKLVSDAVCDGLGDCLGHCPLGAITIERREADEFDENSVAALRESDQDRLDTARTSPILPVMDPNPTADSRPVGGCPGSRVARFEREGRPTRESDGTPADAGQHSEGAGQTGHPSALSHWPVQLRLVPPTAPMFRGARLLVAADCVPVAYADFHAAMLQDHAVVIACPKLDDTRGYVEKLAEMMRGNDLREITVAHMEVPCCTGILHAVLEARRQAGCELPVNDVVVGIQGRISQRRRIAAEPA